MNDRGKPNAHSTDGDQWGNSTPAERALAEADARRRTEAERPLEKPPELAGRGGLDPVRYGDWEVKGLTTDF